MTRICGIDEAGRGPVIGPLVICGVAIKERDDALLKEIGAKDSKLLKPVERKKLAVEIKKIVDFKLIIVPPSEIDEILHGTESNLNWLEADKSVDIINELKPDTVYMDCPSINTEAFTAYMAEKIDQKIALTCAHHADKDYPTVSAASILAKVKRDELIQEVKDEIGIDFGSGYPSDPKTKEFLQQYWDKHQKIFRHSWASYKKVVQAKKQQSLEDF